MLFLLRGKGIIFYYFIHIFNILMNKVIKRILKGQSEEKKPPQIFKTIIFPSFFFNINSLNVYLYSAVLLYLQQMFTEQLPLCCSSFKGWEAIQRNQRDAYMLKKFRMLLSPVLPHITTVAHMLRSFRETRRGFTFIPPV